MASVIGLTVDAVFDRYLIVLPFWFGIYKAYYYCMVGLQIHQAKFSQHTEPLSQLPHAYRLVY